MNDIPGIGHNAFIAMTARTDSLVTNANRWLTERPEIANEDEAAKCKDFIQQLRDELKAVEKERKAEKQPHVDASKAVDSKYGRLKAALETATNLLRPAMTDWLEKVEAARLEAERKAEEDALRKIQEAEDAAAKAEQGEGDIVGNAIRAEEAAKEVEEAVADTDKIANSRAKTQGQFGGRAMSLRTTRVGRITDIDKVFGHYRQHKAVKDVLQRLVNADVRAKDGTVPPGVEVYEERSAT